MQLSQIWSNAYVKLFFFFFNYIRPIVFSDWLKHWKSKTPLSKHLHLLIPCHFTGITEFWSKVHLWGGKAAGNPGLELSFVGSPPQAWPPQHPSLGNAPPFVVSPSHGAKGRAEQGSHLPSRQPPPKSHTQNKSCLINLFLLQRRVVHKHESTIKFVMRCVSIVCSQSQFFQSKGWCANRRYQANSAKQGPKGRSAACRPTEGTPLHQATEPPHVLHHVPRQNRVKHGKSEMGRLGHVKVGEAWRQLERQWKEETKAVGPRHTIPQTDSLVKRVKMKFKSWKKPIEVTLKYATIQNLTSASENHCPSQLEPDWACSPARQQCQYTQTGKRWLTAFICFKTRIVPKCKAFLSRIAFCLPSCPSNLFRG